MFELFYIDFPLDQNRLFSKTIGCTEIFTCAEFFEETIHFLRGEGVLWKFWTQNVVDCRYNLFQQTFNRVFVVTHLKCVKPKYACVQNVFQILIIRVGVNRFEYTASKAAVFFKYFTRAFLYLLVPHSLNVRSYRDGGGKWVLGKIKLETRSLGWRARWRRGDGRKAPTSQPPAGRAKQTTVECSSRRLCVDHLSRRSRTAAAAGLYAYRACQSPWERWLIDPLHSAVVVSFR